MSKAKEKTVIGQRPGRLRRLAGSLRIIAPSLIQHVAPHGTLLTTALRQGIVHYEYSGFRSREAEARLRPDMASTATPANCTADLFVWAAYCGHRLHNVLATCSHNPITTDLAREIVHWQRERCAAREFITRCHLGLAVKMVSVYPVRELEKEDVIAEANEALLRAVDRFDPLRGFKFSTYASQVIIRHLYKIRERHRRKDIIVEPKDVSAYSVATDGEQMRHFDGALVREAFNAAPLTATERIILAERMGADATNKELSKMLGVTEKALLMTENRALAKVRAQLGSSRRQA